MSTFLEDLIGIKDIRTAAAVLPRRDTLHVSGMGSVITDDPVNGETKIVLDPYGISRSITTGAPWGTILSKPGMDTADLIRLTSNSNIEFHTMAAGGIKQLRKTLANVNTSGSNYTFTFKHGLGSTSDLADDYRGFLCPGGVDFVLAREAMVDVLYDPTRRKWFFIR